ncbi:MAG: hypothetical protein KAG94_00680 [Clostridiales bacterium]|nr:hypothetical protein [Clostridiales bacterium]
MLKKTILLLLSISILLFFIGCGKEQSSNLTYVAVDDNYISKQLIKNDESCEMVQKSLVFEDEIDEQEKQIFIAGANMIADFFHMESNSRKFTDNDIFDMGDYAIVNIPTDYIFITARISYEDLEVFLLDCELYAFTQYLYEKIDNYSPEKINEYGLYKYKQDPINELYAKRVIEEFVKETPLSNTKLILENVTFEYKYDTREKEYYTFEYFYVNEQTKFERIFIKVDAYMRKVVQISK